MTSTLSRPSRQATPRNSTAYLPGARTHLPTRLRPADLLRITDQDVADVLDGVHDHLLPTEWDPIHRWSTRIHADDDVDVWLISWTPGEATELHDHAGSLGALTVLSGSLREYHWTGQDLVVRILDAGDQAAFPLGWVHDVMANPALDQSASITPSPAALAAETAPLDTTPTPTPEGPVLSVHAYSPPLTAMSYYEVTEGRGADGSSRAPGLRRTRSILTDQPE